MRMRGFVHGIENIICAWQQGHLQGNDPINGGARLRVGTRAPARGRPSHTRTSSTNGNVVWEGRPLAGALVFCTFFALMLFLSSTPALAASRNQPAQSQTLVAGPYTIVMGLSTSQPIVDQDFIVTIVPRGAVTLSGTLQAQPGPGTDGIIVRRTLVADAVHSQTLTSAIRVPVRGAWTLVVSLNGPQGTGRASMDIIVAVPNAIPPWQGWTIGLLPLVGFVWLIWRQWVYRRTLLKQAYQK